MNEENDELTENIPISKAAERHQELVFIGMKLKHKVKWISFFLRTCKND